MADDSQQRQQLVFQRVHTPGAESTFQDQLRGALKTAPWMGLSALIHAVAILICFNIGWGTRSIDTSLKLQAQLEKEVEIMPPEEPPPPETEVEEQEVVEEEPVVEEQAEEILDEETPDDSPFDAKGLNDVIGVGGGAGGGFGRKYGKRAGRGGGVASQKAVDWGLDWLYRHQHEQGYWGADSFQDECKETVCSGTGNTTCDVGVTGLSLLAFLGAGNTVNTGKYKNTVKKGLRWLKDYQNIEVDGLFGDRSGQYFMYNHAIATLAMCEGYGLSNWPLLRRPAQQGLDFIAQSRNPYKVWRYYYPPTGRDEDNDMSVTGWMLFALASGKDFGLKVDDTALKAGTNFIDEMTDPQTSRTGYNRRGGWSAREPGDEIRWPYENGECMTAVGVLCRILLLEDKNIEPDSIPAIKGGGRVLEAQTPQWTEGFVDFYYWYYGSYAMYQLSGSYWDKWQRAMENAIIKNQMETGCEKGSWDPLVDPWGDVGGRVYSTALNVLSLEVYYRYDRLAGARDMGVQK
ncbi:MAG: hypothetical protein AB1486_32265 [Planctomycetota bacterium]